MFGMTEPTSGPWTLVHSSTNGSALRIEARHEQGRPGGCYTIVRQNGFGLPAGPAGKANARLIAAAPDLLEALRGLFNADRTALIDNRSPVWLAAEDAIEKAIGL